MNILLYNTSSELSARIQTSLQEYNLVIDLSCSGKNWDESFLQTDTDRLQLCLIYTESAGAEFKKLLGRARAGILGTRFVFLLSDKVKKNALSYIELGATAVIHEEELKSDAWLEKLLPLIYDLHRQQAVTCQDRINVISRTIQYFSHEIKNPLTNIDLSASELRDEIPEKNLLAAKFLYFIEKNCRRINDLLSDAVDLIDKHDPVPEKIEMHELFLELKDGSETAMELKAIQMQTDGSEVALVADKATLKQVLGQLIKNSIEACAANGGMIQLSARNAGDQALIYVQDNGSGIAAAHLPHILKPFYSISARSRGLGLTVATELIRRQGGELLIESEPGLKTLFTIALPLSR